MRPAADASRRGGGEEIHAPRPVGLGLASRLADDADAVRRLHRPHRLAGRARVNEMRWVAPLRPGDDLTLDVDVVEARVSKSRPETGIVTFKGTIRNARGEMLCEMEAPIMISRRDAASA
ncbi:FAS1-like dehydratase domain-containing protein [Bradyrhizobium elkanii]|uniref:FAS1-like dehydratase domain-containing protein n=1 Tax=Bradyrhizobium elkanii TaxID=29448 RepID=UPI003F73DFBA